MGFWARLDRAEESLVAGLTPSPTVAARMLLVKRPRTRVVFILEGVGSEFVWWFGSFDVDERSLSMMVCPTFGSGMKGDIYISCPSARSYSPQGVSASLSVDKRAKSADSAG